MTGASKGLQKALARAGSSVIAIAEMQTDDLLAQMTDEQKAAIAATLAPQAEASADATMKPGKENCSEDGDDDDKGGESDPEMGKGKSKGSEASADASATARVKAVAQAVASDENCKGKADLALAMLADDDFASVNASGLVKLLGKTPATTSASADADADEKSEAAARATMLAAIEETGNSDINANAGVKPSGAANATAVWDKVIAKMPGSKAK